jgi:hypothetical protein
LGAVGQVASTGLTGLSLDRGFKQKVERRIKLHIEGLGGVAQVGEHLSSRLRVLVQHPRTAKISK